MLNIEKIAITPESNRIIFHTLTEERQYRLDVYDKYIRTFTMSALPTYNDDMSLDACLETLEQMMLLNEIIDGFTKFENGLMYYKGKSTLRYKSLLKDENFGTYRNSDKEWQSKKYLIEFENDFRANTTLFNSDKIEVGKEYEFTFERKLGKWNNVKKCFNEYTCISVILPKKIKVRKRLVVA